MAPSHAGFKKGAGEMNGIKITPEEIGKAAELIRKVAEGTTQPAEPLTSWQIAEIFQSTHMRIFNRISRFYNAEATDEEKKEFEIAQRPYNGNRRKHPIWKLSEKGCQIYIEKICAEEKRSKAFTEGLEKFNTLITQHFHGVEMQKSILMKGRSRTECGYIKSLFDQFIEGPAIENREIEELGAKYEEFYKAMGRLNDDAEAKRKVEDSVMGVAIEAEMQGFIYGFKVFEVLLNRELSVA